MIHHDQKTCSFSISECSEQLQHVALTPFVVFPLKLQKVPSPPQAHASRYALYDCIILYDIYIYILCFVYIYIYEYPTKLLAFESCRELP